MRVQDLINAPKTDIQVGGWKKGKIPRSDFPLSRARSRDYKYGDAYDWCIIRFRADGFDCRVRVLLREGREIYYATLGVVEGGDTKIVCSYEYHGTEPGWHCHVKCGDIALMPPGQNRFGSKRLPDARNKHRRRKFNVTKASAKQKAIAFYRIEEAGSLI